MRFQAYKISRGTEVLKNAPSPGPLSHKTFRILVSCFDRTNSASLTDICKKFLVKGFGEAPCERIATLRSQKLSPCDQAKGLLRRFTPRKGSPRILISLNAHWYDPTHSIGERTGPSARRC